MKKIMIISLLTMFAFSFENPNGKSFTLTIGLNVEYNRSTFPFASENLVIVARPRPNIYLKLPISSMITLNGGYYNDRFLHSSDYDLDGYSEKNMHGMYNILFYGVELHLPLYKLWEN